MERTTERTVTLAQTRLLKRFTGLRPAAGLR